jgi:hypothetical protein
MTAGVEDFHVLFAGELGAQVVEGDRVSDLCRAGWSTAAYAIETGESRTLTGLQVQDSILNWSADGNALFVGQGTNPVKIYRLDYQTGKRQLIHEINYPITAGIFSINAILIPPDGKSYSYTYTNIVSELFLADGLK